eukprot:2894131-Pyramimonas_sp.AAC.1
MQPTNSGRDRNAAKYSAWHFYMRGANGAQNNDVVKKLRGTCSESMAKKPGSSKQPLQMEKLTETKVQISWPARCVFENAVRILRKALRANWRDYATDPAGAAGAQARAATVAGAAEGGSLEAALGEALGTEEAPASELCRASEHAGLSAPSAAPALGASGSGAKGSPGAGDCRSSQAPLLSLRLEAITSVHNAKDPRKHEDPRCSFEVDWEAELGQGTYGKVYLGTKPRPGLGDDVVELFAIKRLRDSEDQAQGGQFGCRGCGWRGGQAPRCVGLAPERRSASTPARGLQQLSAAASAGAAQRRWTWEAHIGLAFNLYEIDVR